MSCTRTIGTAPSSSSPMSQSASISNGNGGDTSSMALPDLTSGGFGNGVNNNGTTEGQHGRCTTPVFGKSSPASSTSSHSPPRAKMRVYPGGVSSPLATSSASRQGATTPTAGMWTTPAAGALTPVSSGSRSGYCTTGSGPRRKMRGLVRRTHSPRNMPSPLASPVQPHHIVLSPTSSNHNLVMRPSPRQGSSSETSPVSFLAQAMNRTATTIKRKRKHDDKNKTFAPIVKKKRKSSPQRPPSQPHSADAISAVNVMTVNPTVRGIAESARVLLSSTPFAPSSSESTQTEKSHGILSFPTETVYTLCCGITVPPRNCNASVGSTHTDQTPVLDKLLHIKGRLNAKANDNDVVSEDPPLLYLHHSTQAERYAHFTKPKTFVLKPPSQSSPPGTPSGASSDAETPANTKLTAVTFSESREVYRRLTDAFWPGPLVIYVRSAGKTSATVHNSTQRPGGHDAPEGVGRPVLSRKLLLQAKITTEQPSQVKTNKSGEDQEEEAEYIGLRCPSHPLARKILAEAYYGPPSNSKARRRSRNIAIVGFSASPPLSSSKEASQVNASLPPTRAGEVCARLLSFKNGDTFTDPSSPPLLPANTSNATVHVLNGEAKREIFSVPTCQFGSVCPVSILIDDKQRTVHVFKVKSQSVPSPDGHQSKDTTDSAKKTQAHPHADITVDLVTRALLRPSPISVVSGGRKESSDDGRSSSIGSSGSLGGSSCSSSGITTVGTGARLVTAILRKWKVVGEE